MRLFRCFLLSLLCAVSSCSLLPEQIDKTKDWSASQFYAEAKQALNDKDYETAIKYFETLEARYPFGRYAQQAQLEVAYAYYKSDEPESAIAAMDRFIKMHPRHPNVDYAWYLKGLVNFNRGDSIVDRVLPRDPTERDPGYSRQSFYDFAELVKRFPGSKYAEDAHQRMVFLRNNLAQYEINVADFYLRRGAYVAAANRAKYVVENYQGTPAVADALAYMVRAYNALQMNDLSADALRVLRSNYPEHPSLHELGAVTGTTH